MIQSFAALACVVLFGCGGESSNTVGSRPTSSRLAAVSVAADNVTFSGPRVSYDIAASPGGHTVTDTVNTDGTTNIGPAIRELRFADVRVNLPIRAQAQTIAPTDLKILTELYLAFFNRVPEADGLAFWIDSFRNGRSIDLIADDFYAAGIQYSDLSGYSNSMTSEEFVRVIYKNVLGRSGSTAPPAQDVQFWVSELDSGRATKGQLVRTMLNSAHTFTGDPTWGWVATLLDNKYAVAHLFAIDLGLNYLTSEESIRKTMAIAAAVTPADMTTAMALIPVKNPTQAQLTPPSGSGSTVTATVAPTVPAAAKNAVVSVHSFSGDSVPGSQIAKAPDGTVPALFAADSQGQPLLFAFRSEDGALDATSTAIAMVSVALDLMELPPQITVAQFNQAVKGTPSYAALEAAIVESLNQAKSPIDSDKVFDLVFAVAKDVVPSLDALIKPVTLRPVLVKPPLPVTMLEPEYSIEVGDEFIWMNDVNGGVNVFNRTFLSWQLRSKTPQGQILDEKIAPPLEANVLQLFGSYLSSASINNLVGSGPEFWVTLEQTAQTKELNLVEATRRYMFAFLAVMTTVKQKDAAACVNQLAQSLVNDKLFPAMQSQTGEAAAEYFNTILPSFNQSTIEDLGQCLRGAKIELSPKAGSLFSAIWRKFNVLVLARDVAAAAGPVRQLFRYWNFPAETFIVCKANGVITGICPSPPPLPPTPSPQPPAPPTVPVASTGSCTTPTFNSITVEPSIFPDHVEVILNVGCLGDAQRWLRADTVETFGPVGYFNFTWDIKDRSVGPMLGYPNEPNQRIEWKTYEKFAPDGTPTTLNLSLTMYMPDGSRITHTTGW
ncbi:DUF4214 domain-containing protein [Herbaspirillum sp. GCM10030257]|uniref:DUF4214 domain-containing protein n=1 Tax=Herbaspirillum sp. GCM10030257 TaxID=3273393 RepID=UPI003608395A